MFCFLLFLVVTKSFGFAGKINATGIIFFGLSFFFKFQYLIIFSFSILERSVPNTSYMELSSVFGSTKLSLCRKTKLPNCRDKNMKFSLSGQKLNIILKTVLRLINLVVLTFRITLKWIHFSIGIYYEILRESGSC